MPSKLKINISSEELAAISDPTVFYIKQEVTDKLYTAFAQLIQKIQNSQVFHDFQYPADTDIALGKISKGENYLKLPYIILDFPRHIKKPDVFLFRSMFWWGKYFIFTLHIAGPQMQPFYKNFMDNFESLDQKKIYFCINKNQWRHQLGKKNYRKLHKLTLEEVQQHIQENEFIKISIKLPLKEIKRVIPKGVENFEILMKTVMAQ